jgi:hypothetical protein
MSSFSRSQTKLKEGSHLRLRIIGVRLSNDVAASVRFPHMQYGVMKVCQYALDHQLADLGQDKNVSKGP